MITDEIKGLCKRIENSRPLIHCITNIVTVNDCANVLLAIGASPIMAHHSLEVAEISAKASALVLNMGAMEAYEAMINAGLSASKNNVPIILDPVGVAASAYRRERTIELINKVRPNVIRGNLSEINALSHFMTKSTDTNINREKLGVDASDKDSLDLELVKNFSKEVDAIIIVSGATDYIISKDMTMSIIGGSEMLKKVTGSGCMLSSLLGAFYSVDKSIDNLALCIKMVDECASMAEDKTMETSGGTMSFRMHFVDMISKITG